MRLKFAGCVAGGKFLEGNQSNGLAEIRSLKVNGKFLRGGYKYNRSCLHERLTAGSENEHAKWRIRFFFLLHVSDTLFEVL